MKLLNNQINNKIIHKKIIDIPKDVNYKTINSNNIIQNKIPYNNYLKNKVKVNNKNNNKQSSINNNIEKLKIGNNHHSFLERINVNQNKRVIKIHNSFNINV